MATMYCSLCNRPVDAKRHIGVGTVALALFTMGLTLIAIPFYPKRCSICRSTAVFVSPPDGVGGGGSLPARLADVEQRLRFVEDELEAAGGDIRRLNEERDFYRQLLGDPAARRTPGSNQ